MLSLFDKLLKRGLVGGIYPENVKYRERLRQLLTEQKPVTVYTGFDPTSSSLHIGNLATIMNSLHFHGHGHQVICIIGDATARIGDPSGHTKDRKRIDKSVIEHDAKSIEITLRRLFCNFQRCFLGMPGQNFVPVEKLKPPLILRNSEWHNSYASISFSDEVFRHVRLGWLLHKRSIQDRLKTQDDMNMAEFCYQIYQAYDWLELRRRYDCRLQIGGNDQQGNIYTGHDLIKRCLKETDSIGMLAPLITNAEGKKLGKSTSNLKSGIWLDPELTSPYNLYQYFHRTPDTEVEKLLRVFSFFGDDEIESMIKTRLKSKSDSWYCQRKLAEHACKLIHGEEGLSEAKRMTESLFPQTKKNA